MKQLKIRKSTIKIGIDKPIKLLHITDAHIDIIKAQEKAENTDYYESALEHAKENGMFILCTGDNFRGVSDDNLAYAAEKFDSENNIFMIGNHDFCTCPNNTGLDKPVSQIVYSKIWMPYYKQNIFFDSVIIDGVNFVTLQNVYYTITYGQIQMLQREVAKGYPVILCMHIPLFISEKADAMMATWAPCGYMIAAPQEYYCKYDEYHRNEQTPTRETLDAVEYIKNEPVIKAIIAGHIHEDFDGFADCGKRQICTAPLKDGFAREIEIL